MSKLRTGYNVCRVLYGQLHVKSYDWADAQQHTASHSTEPSAATLVMDEVIEPGSEPAVIFPTAGGNIHQFTAVTDCAVLDVLSPPYSPQGGKALSVPHSFCFVYSQIDKVTGQQSMTLLWDSYLGAPSGRKHGFALCLYSVANLLSCCRS